MKSIDRGANTSDINADHALYIVEIPDSDDAPHQARDFRYYVRMSGRNEPAPHWMVEDIRNRRKAPKIDALLEIGNIRHQKGSQTILSFQLFMKATNSGVVTARDLSLKWTIPKNVQYSMNPDNRAITRSSVHNNLLVSTDLPDLHPEESFEACLLEMSLSIGNQEDPIPRIAFSIGKHSFQATLYIQDSQPVQLDNTAGKVFEPLFSYAQTAL